MSLNWLPVSHRVDFKILLFVFKSLNGLVSSYLSELLNLNMPGRCLQSTRYKPCTRLKSKGDRAFAVVEPRLSILIEFIVFLFFFLSLSCILDHYSIKHSGQLSLCLVVLYK